MGAQGPHVLVVSSWPADQDEAAVAWQVDGRYFTGIGFVAPGPQVQTTPPSLAIDAVSTTVLLRISS